MPIRTARSRPPRKAAFSVTRAILLIAPIALASPATAQSGDADVVVMRRVIAPARAGDTTGTPSGEWVAGAWQGPSACGMVVSQTRTVSCVRGGIPIADASCTADRPEATRSVEAIASCTFQWQTGEWGVWSSQCSDDATRTREVTCLRSDGTTVGDEQCTMTRLRRDERAVNHSSCSYSLEDEAADPTNFVYISSASGDGRMTRLSADRWHVPGYQYAGFYRIGGKTYFHPDISNTDAGAAFVAPHAGTFRFTGSFSNGQTCGSGAVVDAAGDRAQVFMNGFAFDFTRQLAKGALVPFTVEADGGIDCDSVNLALDVRQQ